MEEWDRQTSCRIAFSIRFFLFPLVHVNTLENLEISRQAKWTLNNVVSLCLSRLRDRSGFILKLLLPFLSLYENDDSLVQRETETKRANREWLHRIHCPLSRNVVVRASPVSAVCMCASISSKISFVIAVVVFPNKIKTTRRYNWIKRA